MQCRAKFLLYELKPRFIHTEYLILYYALYNFKERRQERQLVDAFGKHLIMQRERDISPVVLFVIKYKLQC